jgi:hypothetical protein
VLHDSHRMHENSLEAYRECKPALMTRAQAIMAWICGRGAVTDRQVMAGMGFSDPNKVRPRITELVEAGELVECGKITEDGRSVRQVRAAPNQLGLFL